MKIIVRDYKNTYREVVLCNVVYYTVDKYNTKLVFKDAETKNKAFKTFNKRFINKKRYHLKFLKNHQVYAEGITMYSEITDYLTINTRVYSVIIF